MPQEVAKVKEDTITRAAWLFGHGYVQPGEGGDVLRCWSQRFREEKVYEVTFATCTCWLGENRLRKVCKHRFACFGYAAVCLILEVREATDIPDLERIGESYADAMGITDECFVKIARDEYRKKAQELKDAQEQAA